MPKPVRLNVIPLAVPTQLVLGLDGVGIQRPKRRRRRPSPWLPAPKEAAA